MRWNFTIKTKNALKVNIEDTKNHKNNVLKINIEDTKTMQTMRPNSTLKTQKLYKNVFKVNIEDMKTRQTM